MKPGTEFAPGLSDLQRIRTTMMIIPPVRKTIYL